MGNDGDCRETDKPLDVELVELFRLGVSETGPGASISHLELPPD
jgi:hypothetical protein